MRGGLGRAIGVGLLGLWCGGAGAAPPGRPPAGGAARVSLRASWTTDAELALLAARGDLRELDLAHTRITDLGLRALAPLRGIRALSVRFAEQVGDEGVQVVKRWPDLEEIDLHGTLITDGTLEVLSRLPRLRKVHAGHARVTDTGLSFLVRLPELTDLAIGGNRITDQGLQALRSAPGLRLLSLGGRQRTDSGLWAVTLGEEGLAAIAALPNLEALDLSELPLTPALLDGIVALVAREAGERTEAAPTLRALGLRACPGVDDATEAKLARLGGLRELDVRGTALSPETVARLRASLPRTRISFAPAALPVAAP